MSVVLIGSDESEMMMSAGKTFVERPFGGGRVWRAVLALAAALLLLAVSSGSALAAAKWAIASSSNTTVSAGGQIAYYVIAKNRGDAATDGGQIDLTVAWPAGMTAVSATNVSNTPLDCSALIPGSPDPFTCTTSDAFDLDESTVYKFVADVSPVAVGVLTVSFEISGGGAGSASVVDATRIAATPPGFGVDAFDGQVVDAAGDPFTQAGGHPYAISTQILLNTSTDPVEGDVWPPEPLRDLVVDLPPGLIGNPTNVGQCTTEQMADPSGTPDCPLTSQIGIVQVAFDGSPGIGVGPVFNLVPPADVPARFAFSAAGTLVTLDVTLRSDGDYGVSVSTRRAPEAFAIAGTQVTIWGDPSDPSHDFQRQCPDSGVLGSGCTVERSDSPFLRNPTTCTAAGVTSMRVDSWVHPGEFKTASFASHLPPIFPFAPIDWGAPQGLTGCDLVPFDAKLSGQPSSPAMANTPSGFTFDVTVPQDPTEEIAQSDLKKAVVTLPQGLRVSPPSADGLQGCSEAQVGLSSLADASCPNGSKLGTLTIDTPLLDKQLHGAIYLATPFANPSGTLLAIYLVAKGPGLIIKLAGKVQADPVTGQLTTTFDNNPQTPFSNLHLEFFSGPRAALVLPSKCGTYTTHAVLTSWSGKTRVSDSSFTLDQASNGKPCPTGHEFTPAFVAGTENPIAGEYSSFLLDLSRDDLDEEIRTLDIDMPQGVLANLNNVKQCSADQAAAGTCGEDSRIGTVTAAAGAGSNPFFVTGKVFFAGPYAGAAGAPFSLSIVVPVVAGPFDLGQLVVRSGIYVDRKTAELKVVSDPIPSILQGIPLQTRIVRVNIDRDRFIINPTNCDAKSIKGTIGSTEGTIAHVSSHFQVSECRQLPLRPRLTLRVGKKGSTRNGSTTPFVTTLKQSAGQSGLKSIAVTLPLLLNARLTVIEDACTQAQFAAGHCEQARIGQATARTPLLKDPLRGSVYFVKTASGKGLPNMVLALRGEIDLDVVGTIKIPQSNRLGATFAAIPDAPISSFTLRLFGGKKGSIGTTANLCTRKAHRAKADVVFVGQNKQRITTTKRLTIAGCPKVKHAKRSRGSRAR